MYGNKKKVGEKLRVYMVKICTIGEKIYSLILKNDYAALSYSIYTWEHGW